MPSLRSVYAAIYGALLFLAAGCGESPSEEEIREPTALVRHDAWTMTEAADDPFSEHRPDEVRCPSDAYQEEPFGEDTAFEVDTRFCNYLTVEQPSSTRIRPGDMVEIRVWHFRLTAPRDARGHVAVQIGRRMVWEEWVPIPTDSGMRIGKVRADFMAPQDTPVYYHIHNHGDNFWALLSMTVHPEE